jgi:hypothetical protein
MSNEKQLERGLAVGLGVMLTGGIINLISNYATRPDNHQGAWFPIPIGTSDAAGILNFGSLGLAGLGIIITFAFLHSMKPPIGIIIVNPGQPNNAGGDDFVPESQAAGGDPEVDEVARGHENSPRT